MAAAAGIVVAQDYAAPDSDNRSVKERLGVLQEVRFLMVLRWSASSLLCLAICALQPATRTKDGGQSTRILVSRSISLQSIAQSDLVCAGTKRGAGGEAEGAAAAVCGRRSRRIPDAGILPSRATSSRLPVPLLNLHSASCDMCLWPCSQTCG